MSFHKGKKNMNISLFYVGSTKIHQIFTQRPPLDVFPLNTIVPRIIEPTHPWHCLAGKSGHELDNIEEYIPIVGDVVCAGFHMNNTLWFIVVPGPN